MQKKLNLVSVITFIFLLLFTFAATAEEDDVIIGHTDDVNSVDFHHNGRFVVSGGSDKSIRIWDAEKGEEKIVIKNAHMGIINAVKYNPAGNIVASAGGDYKIKLWRTDKGEVIKTLGGHFGSVNAIDFHPNGKFLASGSSDEKIKLWDIQSGNLLNTFIGHKEDIYALTFNKNGNILASAGKDKIIRIWEVPSGRLIKSFTGNHTTDIHSLAFSPDGKILASSSWQEIVMWDFDNVGVIRSFPGTDVAAVAFNKSGSIIATGGGYVNKAIKLWNTFNGKLIFELGGSEGAIADIVFSPDGKVLVSGSDDYQVRFWDITTGKQKFIEED